MTPTDIFDAIGAPPSIEESAAPAASRPTPDPALNIKKWLGGKEYLYPQAPESVLDPLPVEPHVKAEAWDAFHAAETPRDFQRQFDALALPRQAKANLFDLKFNPQQPQESKKAELERAYRYQGPEVTAPPPFAPGLPGALQPPPPTADSLFRRRGIRGALPEGGPVGPHIIRTSTPAEISAGIAANPPGPEYSAFPWIQRDGSPPLPSRPVPDISPELQGGPVDPRFQGPRLPGKEPSPADFAANAFSHPVSTGINAALNLDPSGILPGVAQVAQGITKTVAPGSTMRERAGGLHTALSGAMEAATVALPEQLITNPLQTIKILGSAILAGKGTEAGLKHLNVAPEYADLAGDIAGIVAGYGIHWATAPPEVRALVEAAQQFGPNGNPAVDADMIDKLTRMASQHEQSPYEAQIARDMLRQKYNINIPDPPITTDHVPMTAEADAARFEPQEAPEPPEPKPVVNIADFQKAHSVWHKMMTDAAGKFLEDNPDASWDEAQHAVSGSTGVEPKIEDFKALPEPEEPVEPPKPPKEKKPEKPPKAKDVGQTAGIPTEPESPETYAVQLQQLREGTRRVVMFPGGQGMPDLGTLGGLSITHDQVTAPDGTRVNNVYVYKKGVGPGMLEPGEISRAAANNTLPELLGHSTLGMGAPDKTSLKGEPIAVTAHAPDGTEVQTTVTDADNLPQTVATTHTLMPEGGTVAVGTPDAALAGRTGEPQPQAAPPQAIAPTPPGEGIGAPAPIEAQSELPVAPSLTLPEGERSASATSVGVHGTPEGVAPAPATTDHPDINIPISSTPPLVGTHGPIFLDYAGRPTEAIAKLQQEKQGEVPHVWFHPELGWIDLIWGNKNGGLQHIIEKHVQGQKDLRLEDLIQMIPEMRVMDNDGRSATITNHTHKAAIRLDYDGDSKTWLVTAYEKPPAEGYPVVSGAPQSQGGGHPPPDGSALSLPQEPAQTGVPLNGGTGTKEPRTSTGGGGGRSIRPSNSAPLEGQLPEGGSATGSPEVTFTGSTESGGSGGTGDGTVRGEGDELQPGVRTGDGDVGQAPERLTEQDVTESNDKGETVVELEHPPKDPQVVGTNHARDYRIPDNRVISGTPERRAQINLQVLRLLETLELEARVPTIDEQETLAGYVGWGGAKQIFTDKPEWAEAQADLKRLITPEEFESARTSILNAHYTSDAIVDSMWKAMRSLGVKAGMSWLEPAIGSGTYFGRQPEDLLQGTRRIGFDKDRITARIAKYLYPDSGVDNVAFEKAGMPKDFFDFALSNPPFGPYPVHDAEFRSKPYLTESIHNYFFAKALSTVRPGGVIAFITSRYTMDAHGAAATAFRRYVSSKADFLGAVRLPSGAHKQAANTAVITDMIFLRRRVDETKPEQHNEWIESSYKNIRGENNRYFSHPVNEYYSEHPEMILGQEGLARGEFTDHDYNVKGTLTPEILDSALSALPPNVFRDWAGSGRVRRGVPLRNISGITGGKTGGLFFDDKGTLFRKVSQGEAEPEEASEPTKQRIKGQLGLRDIYTKLAAAEREGAPDYAIDSFRQQLNEAYDAFVKKHGFLSSRENQKAMLGDPDAPLLPGLERKYDPGVKSKGRLPSAEKAPVFKQRLFGKTEVTSPKDSKEALSITLNQRGFLDWEHLKSLTGKSDETLSDELSGLVFKNPETKQWETADEYLSGSVRAKLRAAQAIAKLDPAFTQNVSALEIAQPEDVPPSRIKAMLGVTWVPLQTYSQFVKETLGLSGNVNVAHIGNEWVITGADFHPTTRWDTDRVNAGRLIEAALNLRRVKVYDREPGGGTVVNKDETLAASQRQKEINDHFQSWLFSDTDRGDTMVRIYNDLQNDLRGRVFDGAHLTLPGMSRIGLRTGNLEPYQLAAVWRQIAQRNVLLNHAPGAGKTFEMIAAGMELKRLGLIQRPMYVVPNSTLGGWQDQFTTLYPQARVLVFSETDLAKDKRRAAVARIATGDWDAVVIPHSSFQFIPVGDEIFNDHYQKLERELTEAIMEAEGSGMDTRMVTRMEKARERLLTGLQNRRNAARQDNVVTWEQLGVDQLFVDESHEFKKLGFTTKQPGVAGVDSQGNQKTFDLRMKVNYTQGHGRGVVFASGTPITNTMGEAHSIMRYLIEPELEARGIAKFDDWAAEFGRTVDNFERKPEGGGYHMKARFSKFVNLPRLSALLRSFTDVMTSDMLDIPRPAIAGGARQVVISHMNEDQQHFQEHLQHRAAGIRFNPSKALPDGMLVVYNDGAKMAIDVRMVNENGEDDPEGRLAKAAEKIHQFWQQSAENKGTQLVFLDMGVASEGRARRRPSASGRPSPGSSTDFSPYDELIKKITALGIPASEVAHMGQAKNKAQRKKLFQKVNDGELRVLIGSSQKMGIGVNVQNRGYALHHIDIPARPDILEQREARFIRQGNMNPEVHVLYYTTKGTLDESKFGNVVRKGKFIGDVWKGDLTQEEAEDISDGVPSWEMFQAMTSGDPRVLRKLEVDTEVDRLSRLQSAFNDQMYGFRRRLQQAQSEVERLTARAQYLEQGKQIRDKAGRVWVIGDQKFSGEGISEPAGKALLAVALKKNGTIGTAYGLDINVKRSESGVFVSIDAGPVRIGEEHLHSWTVPESELEKAREFNKTHHDKNPDLWAKLPDENRPPATLITRLENDIRGIDGAINATHDALTRNQNEVAVISKDTGQEWPYHDDFTKLINEQKELQEALGAKDDAAVHALDNGQDIADDSVAAEAEDEPDEGDGDEDESADEAAPSRYGKGAGPFSQYSPGAGSVKTPERGWYEDAGKGWYSDGSFAIEGVTPEGPAAPTPISLAKYIDRPEGAIEVQPLAYAVTKKTKDAPGIKVVLFSRSTAIDATYYDYVINRYPRATALVGDDKRRVTFVVDGQIIAVVMGINPAAIPANIKPLLPVDAPATQDIGTPPPVH